MNKFIFTILFTVALGYCAISFAQHPRYYTIHDDNGLPSNEVYQLHQDSFGHIWIGCNTGLFRYDGFRFIPFKNENQNSIAISGLCVSADQTLYCQNFSGQIFYVSNDSLRLCGDVKERIRAHPTYTVDKNRSAWIGLPEGILKRDINGKEELLFKGELYITGFEPGPGGSIFATDAGKGLLKITRQNGKYNYKKIPGVPEAFTNSRSIMRHYGDKLFALSSTNGERNYFITEIRNDSAVLLKKITKDLHVEFIYSLAYINNKLWLGTSSGAICLNLNGDIEQRCFTSEKISDILQDREGNYWFSSLQNGLFIIPDLSIINYTTSNSELKDNNITALKKISSDRVLIGTYSGDVYVLTLYTGRLELLPKNKSIPYRNVTAIIPYDKDHIIVGRGSISVIDLADKKDISYKSAYIRDMVQAGDSIVFASSEMVGAITGVPGLISKKQYIVHNIKNTSGKYICRDEAAGTIWISLNDGLATYDNGIFTPYKINNKPIYCNALNASNTGIWAGTVSDGVYNIRNKKVSLHLDNSNGLIGGNVRCILSVRDTLYIATDACINIFYPNHTFAYIDYTEGLNAKEITALAVVGNAMFIGTIRGLLQLPVNAKFTNNIPPRIRITSVLNNEKFQDITAPVVLPWNSNDVLINFSSVALRSRGHFNYLYRIKGFRDEWKKLEGNVSYIRLNHLPEGNFTFEVKSVNEDGLASADTATLSITANGPFWQHWWFYGLIIVAASSIVALMFMLRIRKIKYNADIRSQVTTSQLTALKAQMNPHFMYNTLNSIQDLILQNDIKNTNYYLSRYSTLMRKILESSESNEIELNEEIEILQLYMELEKLRFGDEFTYSLDVSDNIDRSSLHIPSMIIQPFVENAIKHGLLHKRGPKILQVRFYRQNECLVCTIRDNGVGRKKAAEIKERSPLSHKSFATKATNRRLELINLNRKNKIILQITDLAENNTASGTEVKLEIPLQ